MALDPAWIALVGTVCGGVGLKVAEHWLGRNRVKMDDATQIRGELREEIAAQREEIRLLETEIDKWREQYYELFQKYVALETDLKLALEKVKAEAEAARMKVDTLAQEPPTIDSIDPNV